MRSGALLPIGEKGKAKYEMIKKGDIVKLVTGEEIVFMEMKRTKWNGKLNGRGIIVPLYRDRAATEPFIKAIIGRDESVLVKATNPTKLKLGDIFFLEGHKETFMYFGNKTKRGGRPIVMGRDLASGKNYNIDAEMTMVKIDLNKIKKELVK